MKVKICYLLILVCVSPFAMGLGALGADSKTDEAIRRDANLQESIRRLEMTRESVRQEIFTAKQELNILKEEIAKIRNQETNQVIIVKIILPSTTRPVSISAEKE